jgi:serine phosphatase RsbU (regulator of sigma subunit)
VISFLLLLLFEWDFHFEFLGGNVLLVIKDLADLIYTLPVLFFLLFGIHYLDLREHLRTWYKIAVIDIIVLVLVNLIINGYFLAVPLGTRHWIINVLYVIHIFASFIIPLTLLLVTSIIRIVRGFKPAWYFLLAFVFMIVLGIIQLTSWQQLSAESAYISDIWEILGSYVVIFGVTLQFLVFSLGLARKMKLDEKEMELARQKVIEQLKENEQLKDKVNRELEQKVKERTEEIRAQKEEIEAQRDEIEAQRDQLQEQRDVVVKQKDRLTDSITYAQRIQTAVLPTRSYLDQVMPEYFVLFKPRDIVSGDFYWVKEFHDKLILVAADCTGHGVPGAFMSMLGITLLNEQIGKSRLDTPGEILNWLRKKVKETLAQEDKESEQKDGMDLALAIVEKDRLQLQYAGAYNPLYLVRAGDPSDPEAFPGKLLSLGNGYHLMEYKADRQPVSIHFEESDFSTKSVQLQKGDTLYLFTDGFVDQVGGPRRKKYLSKRFKDLLLQIQNRSLEDQKLLLEQTMEEWSRGYEQIDDILLMGVRV